MHTWIDKLLEGMDTPDGLLFGGLSLTPAFFPFFNSFLQIFPPPRGWSPWARRHFGHVLLHGDQDDGANLPQGDEA